MRPYHMGEHSSGAMSTGHPLGIGTTMIKIMNVHVPSVGVCSIVKE